MATNLLFSAVIVTRPLAGLAGFGQDNPGGSGGTGPPTVSLHTIIQLYTN